MHTTWYNAKWSQKTVSMHIDEQSCLVMCRRLVLVLNSITDRMEGAHRLTTEDEGLLALAQGWAHATTHSIFFYYRCLTHMQCTSACLHESIATTQKASTSVGHARDSLQRHVQTLHARLEATCLFQARGVT